MTLPAILEDWSVLGFEHPFKVGARHRLEGVISGERHETQEIIGRRGRTLIGRFGAEYELGIAAEHFAQHHPDGLTRLLESLPKICHVVPTIDDWDIASLHENPFVKNGVPFRLFGGIAGHPESPDDNSHITGLVKSRTSSAGFFASRAGGDIIVTTNGWYRLGKPSEACVKKFGDDVREKLIHSLQKTGKLRRVKDAGFRVAMQQTPIGRLVRGYSLYL